MCTIPTRDNKNGSKLYTIYLSPSLPIYSPVYPIKSWTRFMSWHGKATEWNSNWLGELYRQMKRENQIINFAHLAAKHVPLHAKRYVGQSFKSKCEKNAFPRFENAEVYIFIISNLSTEFSAKVNKFSEKYFPAPKLIQLLLYRNFLMPLSPPPHQNRTLSSILSGLSRKYVFGSNYTGRTPICRAIVNVCITTLSSHPFNLGIALCPAVLPPSSHSRGVFC